VDRVVRLLLLLLGTLGTTRAGQRETAVYRNDDGYGSPRPGVPGPGGAGPALGAPDGGDALTQTRPLPAWQARAGLPPEHPLASLGVRVRRRRVPRWARWAVALAVTGLIFRKAVASVALLALSAALHLVGLNAHLPRVAFGWPWQAATAGRAANADLGPWVLQKIEGISRPALGRENFDFLFTHKVSKNIGPWPCWYAKTFHAVGHASATVDLNPGPAWWQPSARHYQLQVLSRPHAGIAGHVTLTMALPLPALPPSAHDVVIDDIPSTPVATQSSWTYPGFGCGVLIRPQFPESILYSQAQQIAFYKVSHVPQISRPLIASAESQAVQTIRDNFIQPTVNALGYTLDRLTIRWLALPIPHGARS
jgi:hypothetical protein